MQGAGGGRPAKPDGEKRNRHAPAHESVELPAAGRTDPVPKPHRLLRHDAHDQWEAMWRLPEAAMWRDSDIPTLTRLVSLQVDPEAWRDSKLLAEMRQLEDRFGMNPYARRQMRWVIAEPEDEGKAEKTGTRYSHLRDVSAG